jgi:hypothetical protein
VPSAKQPQERYWRLTAWLPKEMEAQVRALADRENRSLTNLVETLLQRALRDPKVLHD